MHFYKHIMFDYKKYELEKDSETVVVEYLSSKIKVVKKF